MRLYVLGLLAAAAIVLTSNGCKQPPAPEITYEQIESQIGRGELNLAEASLKSALASCRQADWSWRFRIQKARVLASRGHADEAAKLLNDNFPPFLGNTDVAVLRLAILGAAYRINQRFQDSERVLGRAEALATSSHPELLPKVLIEKGSLEVDEGELPSASMSYHQALTLSQAQGNKDQEAAALVNLARLAISERHFAEATRQRMREQLERNPPKKRGGA